MFNSIQGVDAEWGKRGSYNAKMAEQYARERKERFGRKRKLTLPVLGLIRKKPEEEQWIPEQIVGYCRIQGIKMVSHETIYQYIWEDKRAGGRLYRHLRIGAKKYRKRYGKKDHRGKIPE